MVLNASKYGSRWVKWWIEFQPQRRDVQVFPSTRDISDTDWCKFPTHGPDGLFLVLSRQWYILHYHRSTLLLPLGEVVTGGGGVEERSEVMYWHRGAYIIYYRDITCHSCIV